MAQSVVTDRFKCVNNLPPHRGNRTPAGILPAYPGEAGRWAAMLASGEVLTRAELARREGVSRARVSQVLGPRR